MRPNMILKLSQQGQEIFEKFCNSSSRLSVMFPPAPEQTYIDVYPSPDQDQQGCSFVDERRHQRDYEAEVTIYQALEHLDLTVEEYLIVLHNFKYTHGQICKVGRTKDCKKCKTPNNIEGECDFLILGLNFCVILEVKNMSPVEDNSDNRDKEIKA